MNRRRYILLRVCKNRPMGVFGNLPASDKENYGKLAKALSERSSPENQTEMYRKTVKIPEIGQRVLYTTYDTSISWRTGQYYSGYFIDAILDLEMRLKIQQSRPKVFIEAVKAAVELKAFDKA